MRTSIDRALSRMPQATSPWRTWRERPAKASQPTKPKPATTTAALQAAIYAKGEQALRAARAELDR